MNPYNSWKFLYPPRPEIAIVPQMLPLYENLKWVAQFKKNGTNTIIGISPDKKFYAMNRYGEKHKAWALTDHIKSELLKLFPKSLWYVICAEIMHSKTQTIKDTIYIHDILVNDSMYLVGTSFISRQNILNNLFISKNETKTHYVVDTQDKIWYAKLIVCDFIDMFNSIKNTQIDEGLVLKNPSGILHLCTKPTSNADWSVKCRHPTKSYNF